MKKPLEDMTEPELRRLMDRVTRGIDTVLREETGKSLFVVVVFNDPAIAQYASICRRSDIIQSMRETANRLEAMEDVPR